MESTRLARIQGLFPCAMGTQCAPRIQLTNARGLSLSLSVPEAQFLCIGTRLLRSLDKFVRDMRVLVLEFLPESD
jgi:hypothetical protein